MSGAFVKKAVSLPEWTIREQLILASAVQKSGDQNWISVSRAIKPLVEADAHPSDYFSHKNCAQQYSAMLDKAGTHKRKRSVEGTSEVVETAGQQIVRELTEKYIEHLNKSLSETREEYMTLNQEMEQLEKGELDSKLPAMWEELQAEMARNKEMAKLKAPPSTSSLSKYQEQTKKKKKSPSSSQSKEAVADSTAAAAKEAGAEPVAKRKLKIESSVEGVKKSAIDAGPPVTSGILASTSVLNLNSKQSVDVPVTKEPSVASVPITTTDIEGSLSRVATPSTVEMGLPMQTPQPSTHVGQISAEVHVIVQQPNIAAMLVEERASTSITPVLSESSKSHVVPVVATSVAAALDLATAPMSGPVQPSKATSVLSVSASNQPIPIPKELSIPSSVSHVQTLNNLSSVLSTNTPQVSVAKENKLKKDNEKKLAPLVSTSVMKPPPSLPAISIPSAVTSVAAATSSPITTVLSPSITTKSPVPVPKTFKPPVMPTIIDSTPPTTGLPTTPTISPPIRTTPTTTTPITKPPETKRLAKSADKTKSTSALQPSQRLIQHFFSGTKKVEDSSVVHTTSASASKTTSSIATASATAAGPTRSIAHSTTFMSTKTAPVISRSITTPLVTPKPVIPIPFQVPVSVPISTSVSIPGLPVSASPKPITHQLEKKLSVTSSSPLPSRPPLPPTTSLPPLPPPPPPPFPPPPPAGLPAVSSNVPRDGIPAAPGNVSGPLPPVSGPLPPVSGTPAPVSRPPAPVSGPLPPVSGPLPPVSGPPPPVSGPLPPVSRPPPPVSGPLFGNIQPTPQKEEAKLSEAEKKNIQAKDIKGVKSTEIVSGPVLPAVSSTTTWPVPAPFARKEPSLSSTKDSVLPPPLPPASTQQQTSTLPSSTMDTSSPKDTKLPPPQSLQDQKESPAPKVVEKTEPPSTPAQHSEENSSSSVSTEKLATPTTSMEVDSTPSSTSKSPTAKGNISKGEEGEEGEEETPIKPSIRAIKTSLKKQWNTRSRKRKGYHHEDYSVESTDTEDDVLSAQTSAVSSPAPAPSEIAHKQWKKAIIIVWRHAAQHKYANLFLHPVREEDAPGYKNVILRPMDLSTIKKNIELGVIKTDIEFQRDMLLMFQNAFMYNNTEHEVYFMAQEMKNDVMENIQEYLATQAQLQLMEDATPSKTLRSREGRFRDTHDDPSPAKKRRTRADD